MAEWVREPPSKSELAALVVAQGLALVLWGLGRAPQLGGPAALAAAGLLAAAYSLPHELLHALAARALGSGVLIRASRLALYTCFTDPLTLPKASAVYLAPLLATPLLLALGLPQPLAELWALGCVGDLVALSLVAAKRPLAVRCPADGGFGVELLVERGLQPELQPRAA